MIKVFLYFIGAIAIWFVFMSLSLSSKNMSKSELYYVLFLSIGFLAGYFGNKFIGKHPWVLLLAPMIFIIFSIFGVSLF